MPTVICRQLVRSECLYAYVKPRKTEKRRDLVSSKPTLDSVRRIKRQTEKNIKGKGEKSISEMHRGKGKREFLEKVGGETLGRNQNSKEKNS